MPDTPSNLRHTMSLNVQANRYNYDWGLNMFVLDEKWTKSRNLAFWTKRYRLWTKNSPLTTYGPT